MVNHGHTDRDPGFWGGQQNNIKIVVTIRYQIYRSMASTEIIQHFNSGSGRFQINVGHTRATNEDWMA